MIASTFWYHASALDKTLLVEELVVGKSREYRAGEGESRRLINAANASQCRSCGCRRMGGLEMWLSSPTMHMLGVRTSLCVSYDWPVRVARAHHTYVVSHTLCAMLHS